LREVAGGENKVYSFARRYAASGGKKLRAVGAGVVLRSGTKFTVFGVFVVFGGQGMRRREDETGCNPVITDRLAACPTGGKKVCSLGRGNRKTRRSMDFTVNSGEGKEMKQGVGDSFMK
jgi:hypothetical protein